MPLDYPWTCSVIDDEIDSARQDFHWFVSEIIEEIAPNLENKDKEIKEWTEYFYSKAENVFENTRSSNNDIREKADTQIEKLEEQISDLEGELKETQDNCESLEGDLYQARNDIQDLKYTLRDCMQKQ